MSAGVMNGVLMLDEVPSEETYDGRQQEMMMSEMDERRFGAMLEGFGVLLRREVQGVGPKGGMLADWCRALVAELELDAEVTVADPASASEAQGEDEAVEALLEESRPVVYEERTIRIQGVESTVMVAVPQHPETEPPASLEGVETLSVEHPVLVDASGASRDGDQVWDADRIAGNASIDMQSLVDRLRVKARSCRWRATKSFDEPERLELLRLSDRWKKTGACWLWALEKHAPIDEAPLEDFAACYDLNADVVEHMARFVSRGDHESDEFRAIFRLAAEAVRMLHHEIGKLTIHCARNGYENKLDRDGELHGWMKEVALTRRISNVRYMKVSEVVEFDTLAGLRARFDTLRDRPDPEAERNTILNRMEYVVDRVIPFDATDPMSCQDELMRLQGDMHQLIDARVPTSDDRFDLVPPRIRALLATWPGVSKQVAEVLDYCTRRQTAAAERGSDGSPSSQGEVEVETPTTGELIERLATRYPERIHVNLNRGSDPDHRYVHHERLVEALDWLAEDFHQLKTKRRTGNYELLKAELYERCKFTFEPHQSEIEDRVDASDYWTRTEGGREIQISHRLKRGNQNGPRMVRIAFAWDEQTQKVVIGFAGAHQKDKTH